MRFSKACAGATRFRGPAGTPGRAPPPGPQPPRRAMPRRRLHGETQKRRQKLQTARLKRSQSAHRVAATQAPSAFERTGKLERQDVEFLEAMRELRVQPNPLRAIPPERLRA